MIVLDNTLIEVYLMKNRRATLVEFYSWYGDKAKKLFKILEFKR